ncbi:XkdX family protein [Halobacillus karajensis]|uniref:XkdX family protein n=1 Tax=Halobacillus karajensis TaxID=195088 RepID=A0A059NW86_9BACI|nr:XkdX family protein [Halobacillus karajensis]CDQ22563.1 hypothetical protein BN983_00776 [Halobacillus karajensis]CDQ26045.1 hypothetical protein BN981_00256 [Halobacillus karajensis]
MYYDFYLSMWKHRTIEEVDEADIYRGVEKGNITEEEYEVIVNTPKE